MTKRVIFSHPENGWPEDIRFAAQYLVAGDVYTVIEEEIGAWVTLYKLAEFPECGLGFNSTQFEVVTNKNTGNWRG